MNVSSLCVGEAPSLHAVTHWRVESAFAAECESLVERIGLLGHFIAACVQSVAGEEDIHEYDVILCSTYLSQYLFVDEKNYEALCAGIFDGCGIRPLTFLHAYECAGWGYALQFLASQAASKRAIIAIADIDLVNFECFRTHPLIGRSGFGISALRFELPDCQSQDIAITDGPYPESGFREFLHVVRDHVKQGDDTMCFLPYLREDLSAIARRLVGAQSVGEDRAAQYGHCFGSDAWIGLIEWLEASNIREAKTVTATSLAYNGYMTVCPVSVTPETAFEFQIVSGKIEDLHQLIASNQSRHGAMDTSALERMSA
ncbi:MAG: hypothetical protein R3C60_02395 [Parvularculaceae bacterium]